MAKKGYRFYPLRVSGEKTLRQNPKPWVKRKKETKSKK
jgi:hypothetical protein